MITTSYARLSPRDPANRPCIRLAARAWYRRLRHVWGGLRRHDSRQQLWASRASEVRRQMPQGDMDDIAVMELLLAWEARQLEPETME